MINEQAAAIFSVKFQAISKINISVQHTHKTFVQTFCKVLLSLYWRSSVYIYQCWNTFSNPSLIDRDEKYKHCSVYAFQPVWPSNSESTNGVSVGRSNLLWPIANVKTCKKRVIICDAEITHFSFKSRAFLFKQGNNAAYF